MYQRGTVSGRGQVLSLLAGLAVLCATGAGACGKSGGSDSPRDGSAGSSASGGAGGGTGEGGAGGVAAGAGGGGGQGGNGGAGSGSDGGGGGAGEAGSGGASGAGGAVADGGAGGAPPFVAISPCDSPSAYVNARVVGTSGETYDPPCIRVSAGTFVDIEASGSHPLVPRAEGSPANPIPASTSTVDVRFTAPGFFPYECIAHATEGMQGVVWVVP